MNVVPVLDWFKTLYKPDRPVTVEVNGDAYRVAVDGTLGDVVRPVIPNAPVTTPVLELATLTGLLAAFAANLDGFTALGPSAVQVESFDSVALVSLAADEWGRRHVWARAKSREVNPFKFGEYMEPELFLILAQSGFMPIEGNFTTMLKLCSSLTSGSSVQVADDGFSQKVVIQVGGVTHGEVSLPPRLGLRPYRTFREVDPVESDFLLRFKAKREALPEVALLPLEGGYGPAGGVLAAEELARGNHHHRLTAARPARDAVWFGAGPGGLLDLLSGLGMDMEDAMFETTMAEHGQRTPGGGGYVVGLVCTWHSPAEDGVSCQVCPLCGLPVFETTVERWSEDVRAAERRTPGFAAMACWSEGRCFPDFDTLQNAFRQAMEGQQ